MLANC